ncbi:ABC transporter B family member 21 [Zostera marina]|uniref:ABC transporter B family member 21 n=1 Tax=Zostera marina TaxID=29655 RepID=A0A0K9PWX1_ZOSMR|nr:ABC transporter B family member 21 [Zostera marina]
MIVGALAAIANGLSLPIMSILFGEVIDSFGTNSADTKNIVKEVSKIVLKFVYLGLGSGIVSFLQVSCWMITGERQSSRIRGLYLKSILRQDITFFDMETSTGEVVQRMSGDTILIQDAIGEKVGRFIQLLTTFVAGFVVAFIKGWLLSLVMISCLPPLAISGAIMAIVISKLETSGQHAYSEAGTIVEQTIGSIRTVVSFNGEKKATKNYDKALTKAYITGRNEGLANGLGMGIVYMIIFYSYALIVWYGSKLIIEKDYNGGDIIIIIFAIMIGGMSLGQASPCMNAFVAGQVATYKMFQTINRKPKIDANDPNGFEMQDIRGNVELKSVSFSYPTRPEVLIFEDFSLMIPSGTTTALVGESGSGKSTVISLIERFYDPEVGEVCIDDVNLKKLKLGWIRKQIGLVSQEPILFATSIKENILYGKDDATDEEIKKAIKLANASVFIDKMPDGIDTMVGEHGTQLSGGQKQRIAIARAILKNPKILLLDEATSALDAESEHIVQEALLRIMMHRTTIVIAHRLSTIQNADDIAVVCRGKIVEKGSHTELTKDPNGAYSQLIHLQRGKEGKNEDINVNLENSISKDSYDRKGSGRRSFRDGEPSIDQRILENEEEKDDDDKEISTDISLKRLAYLNKPEAPFLMMGILAATVHGVLLPIFGLLLSIAIKIFYKSPDELKKDSKFWALMFVVLGVVAMFVIPLQYYFFGVAGAKLIKRIRSLSFKRVVHQEISWFDKSNNSSGLIGARLSGDASSVRSLVGDYMGSITQTISTITTGVVIAMIANWKVALVILVLIPLMGFQVYLQIKILKGSSEDAKTMYEEASQIANDAVSSIRTVASFFAEKKVIDMYEKKCKAPTSQGIRQGIISGSGYGFSFIILFFTYALTFYVGSHFIAIGQATFDEIFKVFFALIMVAEGVSQTSAMGSNITKAKAAVNSIFTILDRKSLIDSSIDEGKTIDPIRGNIEFKHVSFKYPSRPEIQIFKDFSLNIKTGKSLALVGESGCGKSTVIALLERFYDPNSGQILLDGEETRTLKLTWLRQQMGLVSQEPVLFNDTIRSNIAYGNQSDQVNEEEIITASKAANADEFISSLPNGYNTTVGEKGIQLSGGQKQRIAIARAILKNPSILLLDEATSALDAESERIVQEALDSVMVNRTTIVIAHRLSTIKGANTIAVLKNGEIIEQGRHGEMIDIPNGAYASLVALNASSSTP